MSGDLRALFVQRDATLKMLSTLESPGIAGVSISCPTLNEPERVERGLPAGYQVFNLHPATCRFCRPAKAGTYIRLKGVFE